MAHAFPLAEGASSVGAVIGALGTVAAGLGGAAAGRGRLLWISGLAALCAALAVTFGALYLSLSQDVASWDRAVRQNTPAQTLEGRVLQPVRIAVPEKRDLAWAKDRRLFVSLSDYQQGRAAEDAIPIYLNRRDDESYQPKGIKSFDRSEGALAAAYARSIERPALLVSEHPADIIEIARKIVEAGGPSPYGLVVTSEVFRGRGPAALPFFTDAQAIFSQRVIEIRPPVAVRVSHTLGNAELVPFYDLLLMRDEDLRKAFAWPVVFTSYDETRYSALNARLEAAGLEPGRDYTFYKGGLKKHYETAGLGIVPEHYNLGLADISKLMDVAFLTGKLRFICTRTETCLENIPADMRIDIPFRSLDRAAAKARIEALDPALLYTVMSADQETTGNAYLAGWWLISSGHNYLGEATRTGRFSPNLLWDRMRSHHGEGEGIEGWRQSYAPEIQLLQTIGDWVARYGWLPAFLMLGGILRCGLLPLQFLSTRATFHPHRRGLAGVASAAALVAALVWSYAWLADAISYYAVVPHVLMENLRTGGPAWLDEALALGLTLHLVLSMPGQRRTAAALAGLVVVLYALGILNDIPDPLAVFLLGAEAVALLLLGVMAAQLRSKWVKSAQGIHYGVHAGNVSLDLPMKWRMAEELAPSKGFLVELEGRDRGRFAAEAERLASERLIVRSANCGGEEQGLGGYHQSLVVGKSRAQLLAALDRLALDGCSHAWVQPFLECEETAVVMSIDGDGRRSVMLIGPKDAATEGTRAARKVSLQQTAKWAAVRRLLRRAERHFKGPVLLEVGLRGRRAHLFQVRRQSVEHAQEVALFPDPIESVQLAEDFIARPSRLTGSTISEMTNGDFVYVRGFLYRRSRTAQPILPRTRSGLQALEGKVLNLAQGIEANERDSLAQKLADLRQALSLYREVYLATQARWRPQELTTVVSGDMWDRRSGHELEISGEASLHLRGAKAPQVRSTREVLHDLSALLSAILCMLIARIDGARVAPGDLDVRSLLDPGFISGLDHRDAEPLGRDNPAPTIVPGPIKGRIWPAHNKDPRLATGEPRVLVGEEIGSEWVRHLTDFSGIISVYGDANAHLGLSARALNIPYRRVTREALQSILDQGEADLS